MKVRRGLSWGKKRVFRQAMSRDDVIVGFLKGKNKDEIIEKSKMLDVTPYGEIF